MSRNKPKIALVNQRYGLEVNGGSEYYTRQLAEHLRDRYEVEVLTTKALDYGTWKDYYIQDIETINGVTVRRFHVSRPRSIWGMRIWNRIQRYCPVGRNLWNGFWVDAQGPFSPQLVRYIEEHREEYQVFIFVTYLYYHTVRGIPAVADRTILLPTAHDEPYIYYPIYEKVFTAPQALIYLTPEEKEFVETRFPVEQKPNCVCGSGVDLLQSVEPEAFRKKYGVKGEYLIYVGRIDESKGCAEMFHIFRLYKEKYPQQQISLVLIGKPMMEIPPDNDILSVGYVSEEDKFNAISGAKALWLPSQYESLSIAVLEAMSLGIPVIVNGKCSVLKGHCERSGGGLYYLDKIQALDCLKCLLTGEKCAKMSQYARKYVTDNYQWETVINKVADVIEGTFRK